MYNEDILIGIEHCEQLVVELLAAIPKDAKFDTERTKVVDSLMKIRHLRSKVQNPTSKLEDLLKLVDEADGLLREVQAAFTVVVNGDN